MDSDNKCRGTSLQDSRNWVSIILEAVSYIFYAMIIDSDTTFQTYLSYKRVLALPYL